MKVARESIQHALDHLYAEAKKHEAPFQGQCQHPVCLAVCDLNYAKLRLIGRGRT